MRILQVTPLAKGQHSAPDAPPGGAGGEGVATPVAYKPVKNP